MLFSTSREKYIYPPKYLVCLYLGTLVARSFPLGGPGNTNSFYLGVKLVDVSVIGSQKTLVPVLMQQLGISKTIHLILCDLIPPRQNDDP